MSNENEKDGNTSENVEVVQASEVLFTEQQTIIQSLKQELEASKKKVNELQDSLRRLAADFENYKKWSVKERQTVIRTANESLIKKLLDVYVSLDNAANTAQGAAGNDFLSGVRMIYKEFSRILQSEGLEPITAVGVPLDVNKHEVLMRKVNDDVPEDTILEEIQKGYLLNNFLLRPAKVVVSQKSTYENTQSPEKQREEIGG